MAQTRTETHGAQSQIFAPDPSVAVVRYHVQDVDRAVSFYTEHLGFKLKTKAGPVATVVRGDLHVLLSGPSASGSRPLPGGEQQKPGGWNRIVLYVDNLDNTIAALKDARAQLRGELMSGPGGNQIQIQDLDGNPIELHEAPGK